MVNIVTIVGARPQFIKAAPVSVALSHLGYDEKIVHTGQHYDHQMSQVFFDELGIPKPEVNIAVGSGSHGWQTGQMLMRIEEVLLAQKPDFVIVYGDTNSTLAGALAAQKLRIRTVHVEAGLRSFNREMPEETNRVLTDHCSDLLFCPTGTAVENLAREGIVHGVHLVGDVMLDAALVFGEVAQKRSRILEELEVEAGKYLLVTLHRPYNVDDPEALGEILWALEKLDETVIFPVHPRTRKRISALKTAGVLSANLKFIEPVGYLDMLMLEKNARLILTDSGGIQKEAYFFCVPCVTLRPETEWVETVEEGWNVLTGSDAVAIVQAVRGRSKPNSNLMSFGNGHAAEKCAEILRRVA